MLYQLSYVGATTRTGRVGGGSASVRRETSEQCTSLCLTLACKGRLPGPEIS